MKKTMMFVGVTLVALVALTVAGFAYAQTQTPAVPGGTGQSGTYGPGAMGGRGFRNGGFGGGMFGQGAGLGFRGQAADGTYGPIHDYMVNALAKAFGMTPQELEARLDAGDTMWTVAQEKGLTADQFRQTMTDARSEAIKQAAADGVISQEQADFMLGRANQIWPEGYGPGSANCDGTGPHGRGGMRWNNQTSQ